MGRPSTVKDITDAVLYLTDAATVTGHILYFDGGAHFGRWLRDGAFVMITKAACRRLPAAEHPRTDRPWQRDT
jgi:hypothetical protein